MSDHFMLAPPTGAHIRAWQGEQDGKLRAWQGDAQHGSAYVEFRQQADGSIVACDNPNGYWRFRWWPVNAANMRGIGERVRPVLVSPDGTIEPVPRSEVYARVNPAPCPDCAAVESRSDADPESAADRIRELKTEVAAWRAWAKPLIDALGNNDLPPFPWDLLRNYVTSADPRRDVCNLNVAGDSPESRLAVSDLLAVVSRMGPAPTEET